MNMHKLLLLSVACIWAVGASAQWQWVDKDGRKVYSDRAPPEDVPQKNILKSPRAPSHASAAVREQIPAASPAAVPASDAASPPGKDKDLEAKKAQAEAAESAKKQAEADLQSKARAENCARARQAHTTLNSGQLLAHTNAQGVKGFMDEATRATEVKRAEAVIASDCSVR